jgi:hypothetical protein
MLWLAEKPREVLAADRPGSSPPYALEVADVGDRVQPLYILGLYVL